MTVSVQTPFNEYTANGATTVFAYTFEITSEDEITVYVDDVEQVSGFTLSGVGDSGGGAVTFDDEPTSGSSVLLIRTMDAKRETDYQNSGDFRANTVNADFDRLWLYCQQLLEELSRRPELPLGHDAVTIDALAGDALLQVVGTNRLKMTTLAEISAANQILIFAGDLTENEDTVDALTANSNLVVGQEVKATEYSSGIGFIDQTYQVVAYNAGTDNGVRFIQDTIDGLQFQLKLIPRNWLSNRHAGFGPGATDRSTEMQALIDTADALGFEFIDLDEGQYVASGLTGSAKFRGNGAYFSDLTYRVEGHRFKNFNVPSTGFSGLPFSTYSVDGVGRGRVDFDVEQYWLDEEVQGIVNYYVDYENGSDAAGGTSPNAPLKTINAAAQKSDVGVIQLMDGIHFDGLDGHTPTRDIEIRSFSGKEVIIRMGEDPRDHTWTITGGTAYTFQATISRTINMVLDSSLPDGLGGYKPLTLRASSTEVNNNPGSWYYDSGTTTLYIRCFNNRYPGAEMVLLTGSVNDLDGDQGIYLENLKIEGGAHGFQLNATSSGTLIPRLYAKNCRFFYSVNFGLDSNGGKSYLQNCTIAWAGLDNLNYHVQDAAECLAVEIDCISYGAGMLSQLAENNNASSMHDGGTVCRVNGEYYDSYGPVVIDTNDCYSLNIGVRARDPQNPTTPKVFQGGGSGTETNMYLHCCESKANGATDYYADNGNLFIADCLDDDTFTEADASSHVKQYWPSANN